MYAKTVQGFWPRELNVYTNITIDSEKGHRMFCWNYKVRTHRHDVELQFGALIWATTRAEKINKDASKAVTRRDISCPRAMQVVVLEDCSGPLLCGGSLKFLNSCTA